MSSPVPKIRIATRESRLALAQTHMVADALRAHVERGKGVAQLRLAPQARGAHARAHGQRR